MAHLNENIWVTPSTTTMDNGNDLIDFEQNSPTISRTCSQSSLKSDESSIHDEHLLDSELLKFEQVLGNAQNNDSEIEILDCDPILINLDDAEDDVNIQVRRNLQRSNSALLLELFTDFEYKEPINRSKSANDLELFEVLMSNQRLDSNNKISDDAVETCLLDLDQYLDDCVSNNLEDCRHMQRKLQTLPSKLKSKTMSKKRKLSLDEITMKNLPVENRTENFLSFKHVKDNPLRNTIATLTARKLPSDIKRKYLTRNTICGRFKRKRKLISGRSSPGALSTSSDDDIDWSWVYKLENNQRSVNALLRDSEQQSVLVNSTCAGCSTTVVECSVDNEVHDVEMPSTNNDESKPRSWLRSSMRRLRHFRLPDTEEPVSIVVGLSTASSSVVNSVTTTIPPSSSTLQQSNRMDNLTPQHGRNSRPSSAPTRLHSVPVSGGSVFSVSSSCASSNNSSVVLDNVSHSMISRSCSNDNNNSRSRSRSSHNHHNRTRSSSESSRSAATQRRSRPRSISSTDSSIGSSIDTSPSCSPIGSPARNNTSANNLNSTSLRRLCDIPPVLSTNNTVVNTARRNEDNVVNGVGNRATNTGRPPGVNINGGVNLNGNNISNGVSTNGAVINNTNNNIQNDSNNCSDGDFWKHRFSSMLASLGCTLGIFNISRFAILSVHFGANFIVQFMVLSLIFGIPLFTLHSCLGQQLGTGVVSMWKISPIFQGVGIALLMAQMFIGIYSIIGISWLFVFFRDSFITKMDNYKWAEPFELYRFDQRNENGSYKISETIPDYFNGQVLQRYNLAFSDTENDLNNTGGIKFQLCFNLAVVWVIIFASLSKGLKSYSKIVFLFTLLPLFCMFVLCTKLLGLTPSNAQHGVFSETSWPEFFLNTKCWVAAFQESFLTWGLFGAAAMQIASHNKHKHLLQRDAGLVIVITCTVLLLVAFLANTCVDVLRFYGFNYLPGSFENTRSYIFMRNMRQPLPPSLASTPVRYMKHSSLILGERIIRPGVDHKSESGYQPLRFATELIPATFTVIGPDQLSPFWAVLFYFIMILFGISQQLAIWHCVINGIIGIKCKVLRHWQISITFFSCAIGFLIGILMTTEYGIYTVYFFDYCVGGAWWIAILYMVLVSAVFMIRGRPYSGDSVVTAIFAPGSHACLVQWAGPLLSFTWNVVLPVALVVYSISTFKNGNFRELYAWHHANMYDYWPLWLRQLGCFIQLIPILTIPIGAFVQSYRYLNSGPPDILDRIQLLYRPPLDSEHMEDLSTYNNNNNTRGAQTNTTNTSTTTDPAFEDPPPKYTPPPSYTTATGARIAKLLRQSIRRSVRRIASVLGESSDSTIQNTNTIINANINSELEPPPPDYAAVLVEMNHQTSAGHIAINIQQTDLQRPTTTVNGGGNGGSSTLTAADVAQILRSSIRRSTIRAANTLRRSVVPEESTSGSLSVVCLVDGAEPIGQDSFHHLAHDQQIQKDNIKKDDLSSVI